MTRLSEVKQDNEKFRIDDGYFSKLTVLTQRRLEVMEHVRFGDAASVFRKGIFDIRAESYTESGVPFVRVSNLKQCLIDSNDLAYIPEDIHCRESKTELHYGDIVLSKTGTVAASFVNVARCNVSQDCIAVQLSAAWRKRLSSGFVVAFLNSSHGMALLQRLFQGNVQAHLSLPDGKKVPIPIFSEAFQKRVHESLTLADIRLAEAGRLIMNAQQILISSLGLDTWQPPEPLTYTRRSAEVFAAGRMDAEHFQPAYNVLFSHLRSRGSVRLGDIVRQRIRRGISPIYVEDGDMTVINSQHIGKTQVTLDDNRKTLRSLVEGGIGNRTGIVQQGDVLLNSTGRITMGRSQCLLDDVTAVVDNHVAIIRPKPGIDPVYLACYLNSLPGQMQTERGYSGSSGQIELRPDVVEDYLIWDAPQEVQSGVRNAVESSHAARRVAQALLDRAKRAVEIAIEESEAAALAYLDEQEN